jgi:hypothetical protein
LEIREEAIITHVLFARICQTREATHLYSSAQEVRKIEALPSPASSTSTLKESPTELPSLESTPPWPGD